MSERVFRIILGASLMLILFLRNENAVYAFIGLMIFEGITNWRIPILVSKLRFGSSFKPTDVSTPNCRSIPFDAERALRLVVASLLIISYIIFPLQLWLFPWFIGFMLFMAGLSNICPMAMTLHWVGFR